MSNKVFRNVPVNRPRANAFDLSHEKKLSFQIGQLVPIFMQDIVPSDRFRVSTETLVRFAPLLAPIMHRVDVFVHYFFVPYRIIWDDFESFITGGEDGTDATVLPYRTYSNANKAYFDKGTVMDYLGIPPTAATITQDIDISVLPLRAYLKIYNDYYRNPEFETEKDIDSDSNGDCTTWANNYPFCYNRYLERDYFTSCLTAAQRGNPVELDLDLEYSTGNGASHTRNTGTGAIMNGIPTSIDTDAAGNTEIGAIDTMIDVTDHTHAVLEIAELRRAARLQEWMEKQNIGGGRYRETVLLHFGQRTSDHRLDRVEYLGGGRQPVQISEVLSTAETLVPSSDALSTPPGSMAGKGISIGKSNRFEKTFEEHGLVMGIISVMPRTAYQEGIDRYWRKSDKTEFLWPAFAQLGEQEVLQSEIYWDPTGTDKDDTFGYQQRYAEYKWAKSTYHGDFIDDFDYWHMGRQLGSAPTLNQAFGKCESTDYDRIFAVTTGSVHKLYAQIYNDVQAIRPLPEHNVPTL
jgi:hypothetical protein